MSETQSISAPMELFSEGVALMKSQGANVVESALRPGWLQKQLGEVSADFATWPEWMKREAVLRTPPVGTGGVE